MERSRPLAPSLISFGTVTSWRDMLRALETLETVSYRHIVHGEVISEGQAALVKLMADPESATMIVNGCLFLNVGSYRYLDFEQDADAWRFNLVGDDSSLELIAMPDAEEVPERTQPLLEDTDPDLERIVAADDEDDLDD